MLFILIQVLSSFSKFTHFMHFFCKDFNPQSSGEVVSTLRDLYGPLICPKLVINWLYLSEWS